MVGSVNLSTIGGGLSLNLADAVSNKLPVAQVESSTHEIFHKLTGLLHGHPLEAGLSLIIYEEISNLSTREEQQQLIKAFIKIGEQSIESDFWTQKEFQNLDTSTKNVLEKLKAFILNYKTQSSASSKPIILKTTSSTEDNLKINTCTPSQWKEIFDEINKKHQYYCVRPQCHGDCGKPFKQPVVPITFHTCNDPTCTIDHETTEVIKHTKAIKVGSFVLVGTFVASLGALVYFAFFPKQPSVKQNNSFNQIFANSSFGSQSLLSNSQVLSRPSSLPQIASSLSLQATKA
jgi:hypothetical protein